MKEKLKFARHVLFHPIDGFWDAKYENRGSVLLALVFVFLWVISNIITRQFTSFLYNTAPWALVDFGRELTRILVIFALFCLGNWSVTTLMDGKGRMRDIVVVFGYSTLPLSMINIPLAFLSLFLTYNESVYYMGLTLLASIWFFYLLFMGIMTVHEYTIGKMIVTTGLTVLAMAVLVFIYLLFFFLISQVIGIVMAVYQELVLRL